MELYWGPTTDFVEQATRNRIAGTLRAAWIDSQGYESSDSEQRSWRVSLGKLASALRLGGLNDQGILVEYQVPLTSRRIDALITGHDHAGRACAVVVELKQWDGADISPSKAPELVGVMWAGKVKEQLHPSAQAGGYARYLADTHTAFHGEGIRLRACSYLHDFLEDPDHELLASRHANILGVYPLFPGDRVDDLITFLSDHLGSGGGLAVLRTVREGRYRPSRKLLAHAARMIDGEPSYELLDEQRVVFNSILASVHETLDTDRRAAYVIRGGPGTGKSVLAMQLVGELAKAGLLVNHSTGSAAFTNTARKIVGSRAAGLFTFFNSYLTADDDALDVLVCDEAHRIRKHSWNRFTKKQADDPQRSQVDDLLRVAKVGVFFIDDLQTVRRDEIGNSDDIERAAAEVGAEVHEFRLEAQFRCGGSDGFIRWVENTLGVRRTANALWGGDDRFDFEIVYSPEELEAVVQAKAQGDETARLVAGYCWPWSQPRDDGSLPDDVMIGDWARPWNARPDAVGLAPGIPKSHVWAYEPGGRDQVGCVYTAQGFEFDHVGVIFGRDLIYRPGKGWVGQRDRSKDNGLKRGVSDDRFTELVKNTYRVLLTRGMRSCTLYVIDDQTRAFFESRLDHFALTELIAAEDRAEYTTER